MRSSPRSPFTKSTQPHSKLNDQDIQKVIRDLSILKNQDFPHQKRWDEIERMLSSNDVRALRLCKILYVTGFRKEMFLHLGVIVESRLNSVISLYKSNNWAAPNNFIDESTQEAKFEHFLNKKSLSEKADFIFSSNLFNNLDFSDRIRHKVQAFRFLRNYGGHSKSVNDFFQLVIDSQPDCDNEIEHAFNLVKELINGNSTLLNNPPSNI